jgi:small subunit ribosomal protein S4
MTRGISQKQGEKKVGAENKQQKRPAMKKRSEYGKQLYEKQRVKELYGMREKQFRRFFDLAVRAQGSPGENLLSFLERRLDNVVYRLKMATSRKQARQIVVHGHVCVNGRRVSAPSYFVKENDTVTFMDNVSNKKAFVESVIEKRMKVAIKVPEWLELDKDKYLGRVLRNPVRNDIQTPIEEHLIVELYSK